MCRRDINQNVSTLLDELDVQQRPISAPPHLDDRWAAQLVRRGQRASHTSGSFSGRGRAAPGADQPRFCAVLFCATSVLSTLRLSRGPCPAAPQPASLASSGTVHSYIPLTFPHLPPSPQGQLAGAVGPDQKLSTLADIRLDEDYDRFYAAQVASGKKLPPPLDNRTLYQELPQYQQLPQAQAAQQISPELAQHLLQQRAGASPAPSNGILAAAGAWILADTEPRLLGCWNCCCDWGGGAGRG